VARDDNQSAREGLKATTSLTRFAPLSAPRTTTCPSVRTSSLRGPKSS